MNIPQILARTPKDTRDRFKALARNNWDDDNFAILEYMFEEQLTPWTAARKRHDSGLSKLSRSALFHRAKQVEDEIQFHFGESVDSWIQRLKRDGEVRDIPLNMVNAIKKELTEADLQFRVTNVIVLEGP